MRDVFGAGADTGWVVLFVIWLVHLLLTVVIGWFVWRHVRRTRLAVLPPRAWMAAMGGALLLVAIVLFVTEKVRVDVVALMVLLALVLTGIVVAVSATAMAISFARRLEGDDD